MIPLVGLNYKYAETCLLDHKEKRVSHGLVILEKGNDKMSTVIIPIKQTSDHKYAKKFQQKYKKLDIQSLQRKRRPHLFPAQRPKSLTKDTQKVLTKL